MIGQTEKELRPGVRSASNGFIAAGSANRSRILAENTRNRIFLSSPSSKSSAAVSAPKLRLLMRPIRRGVDSFALLSTA